jgi:glycosyltransferase involved in cell wall biosynthesis
MSSKSPKLSVVIKAFNEERAIGRCIESALEAVRDIDAEVIVADCFSLDRTVEIALRYPVTVARMTDPADRSCGAGAQLGFQYATGEYLLLVDADMVVLPEFIHRAIAAMDADSSIVGAGGMLEERSSTIEYQTRRNRKDPNFLPGEVSHLTGSALYRMSALRALGYFTDRNLQCVEECELAIRLRHAGGRLLRIDAPAVIHYGHIESSWRLLWRRSRNGSFFGYGSFLRAGIDKPYRAQILWALNIYLAVVAWWLTLTATAVLAGAGLISVWVPVAVLAWLPAVAWWRKRDFGAAAYSLATWNAQAVAMLIGSFRHRVDPSIRIDAEVLTGTARVEGGTAKPAASVVSAA